MAPKVTLTVRERTGSKGSLETVADAIRNPPLEKIGRRLEAFIAERFATRTGPDGKPWAPPSPTTVALRGGIVETDIGDKRFHRVDKAKNRVAFGIRSPAARTRQYGAPRNRMYGGPPAPVPARPALPMRGRRVAFPPKLHAEIMAFIRGHLDGAKRKGG